MRVISLLPSATEIVDFLGHRGELLGRSEECDFPPEVRSLPVVMRARTLDGMLASREIDARVQRVRGAGESLYVLDIERLRSLRPDLLLTQDLCAVCSVTGEEVSAACRSAGLKPEILSLSPRTLEEVWATIPAIANALHDESAGRQAEQQLSAEVGPRTRDGADAPRIAIVEWLDPPILAGSWAPDMVEWAGGRPYGPVRPGAPEVRTTWEAIAADPPDLVLLSPCSFPVGRTAREVQTPKIGAAIAPLARRTRVWIADEAYFSRPGPRLRWGIELLRELVRHETPRAPMPAIPLPASVEAAVR